MQTTWEEILLKSIFQDIFRLKTDFRLPEKFKNDTAKKEANLLQKAAALAVGKNDFDFSVSNFTKAKSVFGRLKINDAEMPKHTQIEQFDSKTPFRQFDEDAKNIENLEKLAYAETLLALADKHFSDVTCGCQSDIPFSVFAKTKAAFAVCLAQNNEKTDFLLAGGDISGIQGYIYDIASKNASKSLKGRSFYLQMLINSLVMSTLEKLNLPYCNVIYDSGGKFYLLAPDTEDNRQKIKELQKDFEKKIFEEHGIDLYFSLDYEVLNEKKLTENGGEGLSAGWGSLNEKFTLQKRQKYKNLMQDNFEKFFGEKGIEGSDTQFRDPVTGAEISENDFVWIEKDDNKGEFFRKQAKDAHGKIFFKKTNYEPIYAGKILKSVTHIVSVFNDKNSPWYHNQEEIYVFNPCKLNVHHLLIEKTTDVSKFIELTKKENSHGRIACVNSKDFIFHSKSHQNYAFRTELYGGNDYPIIRLRHNEAPKTFSEMAGMKEDDREYESEFQELKFKRYAVLRMDVDNLGSIFQKSLSGDVNFARYATLSRSLDVFFKGKLNELWKNGFSDDTQIIYAGGDDLFIVGRWDKIIDFAEKIRSEFRNYVGRNDIGISAGIAVVSPKFPIAKAAQMAGDAEKEAKKHGEGKKNAVCFLGETVSWHEEFDFVRSLKNIFKDYIKEETLSKGVVYKLYSFHEMKQKGLLNWRWLSAYYLHRDEKEIRAKNNTEFKNFLGKLKVAIFTDNVSAFDGHIEKPHFKREDKSLSMLNLVCLAVRWAELELRTKTK